MSLLDVLRSGVKITDKVTKPLQPFVTYKRQLSTDDEGTKKYAGPKKLRAIVDWRSKQVRTSSGELTVTRATITLLDVVEVAKATANQGVGDYDIFILPDGTTGPILDISGFIDAGTGQPIATEVMLG